MKRFGDEKRFIVNSPGADIVKVYPKIESKWMFGNKEVVPPRAAIATIYIIYSWKKWREDVKADLKKDLLEDEEFGKKYVAQRQQSPDSSTDNVSPDKSFSYVSMLDTGNFVLYNSDQKIIWQSFDHPTEAILPGQNLSNGQELFSSRSKSDYATGIFRRKMQIVKYLTDGFLRSREFTS
ncbi:hypothetical protein DCAR_0728154 [Daucus carota subsp. sativus]|uniref:Bulb-type lectin domain-containing protein n=1 Tax=Daucus carota subsp. sativus TaxID=79200 RepID=A0AAF1B9B8_DAUCS|nr:hypothetical protein DCAR_0728154 [Daucus carota subsp. sativus]